MNMHIAVAGNIGSGKTTLTSLLAKQYGWEAQYEDVDDNPYLNDFLPGYATVVFQPPDILPEQPIQSNCEDSPIGK